MSEKRIIGWTEYVDLPDWGIKGIKAKVDTGARTSALHVENLEDIGHGQIRFDVLWSRKPPFHRKTIVTHPLKWARVRSSSGHYSIRCFVRARIQIGLVEKAVELSLVSRQDMLFRMLLGRKALEHDFWVDVSRRNLLTRSPRRSKKNRPSDRFV